MLAFSVMKLYYGINGIKGDEPNEVLLPMR
jgi:hypothetical protein